MERKILKILNEMESVLDISQMKKLQETLFNIFAEKECEQIEISNEEYLNKFIVGKSTMGLSKKTLKYYSAELKRFFATENLPALKKITHEDVKQYISDMQMKFNSTNRTLNNTRRILSSFFGWLVAEDFILYNPMKKVYKIKEKKLVKKIINDEAIELLRDNAENYRDMVIIDFLYSTGVRVGELVNLNKDDVDLLKRECIVFGKGGKERIAYFDAKTKIHLLKYLESRKDDNPALFVSLLSPYKRLEISGVEIMIRKLGQKLNLEKIHPHKFRRSMATRAINKGMPIEQVQKLLGHSKVDTTLEYALVDQENVKISHNKYLT